MTSKAKKRKLNEDNEALETAYENQIEDTSSKRVKARLPIKTQRGLVGREIVEDIPGKLRSWFKWARAKSELQKRKKTNRMKITKKVNNPRWRKNSLCIRLRLT